MIWEMVIASCNDDVRGDSVALELSDGVLGWLGFIFIGTRDIWNEGNVDEANVFFLVF